MKKQIRINRSKQNGLIGNVKLRETSLTAFEDISALAARLRIVMIFALQGKN